MRQIILYLRNRPFLVAGTLLLIATYWTDKLLVNAEQDYLNLHDKQTNELFHNISYLNEAKIARYLVVLNQEKFPYPAARERAMFQTLSELGLSIINYNYMNRRRGASTQDLHEMESNMGESVAVIYNLVKTRDSITLRHMVDSLQMTFSVDKFLTNQLEPYAKTFSSWAHHYKLDDWFSRISIFLYVCGSILLSVHAYKTQQKEELKSKEEKAERARFLTQIAEALKRHGPK